MANTFSVNAGGETVMGNMRVRMGVLSMDDGAGGSSVASGFNYLFGGIVCMKSATSGVPVYLGDREKDLVINTNVNGDFKAVSAVSGDTFEVIMFGR